MKLPALTPKRTAKGWLLNIPARMSASGTRQRFYFPSRDAALKESLALRAKHREGDSAGLVLPRADGLAAEKALALIHGAGFGAHALIEAAESYIADRDHRAGSVPFAEAVKSYAAARTHRTQKHLGDILRTATRFAGLAPRLCADITGHDVEDALAGLPGPSRNHNLRLMRSVFAFAVRRGWCKDNPAGRADFAHTSPPSVPTITAKAARRLFVAALRLAPEIVPLIAVELFAGVRPAEAVRLKWENIDIAEGVLTVPREAAKTRRARHVAMHPNLQGWLAWSIGDHAGDPAGPLCPLAPGTLRKRLRAIRCRAKLMPWGQDCLRHTFASAALACGWRDVGALCLDLGHTSPGVLFKHYHRAMRKTEGAAIFAVCPPERINADKILAFRAA